MMKTGKIVHNATRGEYDSVLLLLLITTYRQSLLITISYCSYSQLQNLKFCSRELRHANFRDFIQLVNFAALRDILNDTCLTLGVIIWHIWAPQCALAHVCKQEEKEKLSEQPFARERAAGLTDQFIPFLLFSFSGEITRFRELCNPLLSPSFLVFTPKPEQ